MMPWVSWFPFTLAPPFLAYASSSPASVIGSAPTLLTTSCCGLKLSLRLISRSSAVNAGMENDTTTWAPAAFSAATCGPMLMLVGS